MEGGHRKVGFSVNFKIIPFGHASVEIKVQGGEEEEQPREKEVVLYLEPRTTNLQSAQITFDGNDYTVPTTTGSFF
jgi:hypothetical protein